MKNLKKILSLVLALAMALSLMTVAFAKDTGDFADGDDVTYAEAVDVMATIGVFNGVGDGSNFDPNGNLTREQAAKIITYMLMGQTQADKLVATIAPYADVSADRWSAGAIAYCASEGIMNGTGNGKFNPTGELTGLQFAKMLLGALGYDAEIEEMTGVAWGLATSKLAYAVELDDGMDNINLTDVITRQQAAQMAFTAMKTPLVEYADKGTTITVNGAIVEFGAKKANYVTTTIAKEQTISKTTLSNTKEDVYTIEFGEKYCPKLVLKSDSDDFKRPAHTWTYDKKDIGTYVDYDLMEGEYTVAVDGRDLYDLLGKSMIEDNTVTYYHNGKVSNVIEAKTMVKANDKDYSTTGNGVLTQVFVDTEEEEITIVSIDTFLAEATGDYNEKKESLSVSIYAQGGTGNFGRDSEIKLDEISAIESIKKDDRFLVQVAWDDVSEYEIVALDGVESQEDVKLTKYSNNKYVVGGGTQYDYALNGKLANSLNEIGVYGTKALVDFTYNLYFDQYGYLIGNEVYSGEKHYVFIAGYDLDGSHLATAEAKASAIFLDGTMKNIQVNVSDTNDNINDYNTNSAKSKTGSTEDHWYPELANGLEQYNMWFTYTTESKNGSEVYTLTPAKNWMDVEATGSTQKISTANMRLTQFAGLKGNTPDNASTPAYVDGTGVAGTRAYGNDDSVYITVDTGKVSAGTSSNKMGITEVTGTYTGVQNVDLQVWKTGSSDGENQLSAKSESSHVSTNMPDAATNGWKSNTKVSGVFAVYDDDLYIIGAIVVGEDNTNSNSYAYILKDARNEYIDDDDNHYWDFEAVVDGKIETLTVKVAPSKYSNVASKFTALCGYGKNGLAQVTYDKDGYVTDFVQQQDVKNPSATGTDVDKVYGCLDYTEEIDPDTQKVYSVEYKTSAGDQTYGKEALLGSFVQLGRSLYNKNVSEDNTTYDAGLPLASGAPVIVVRHEVYSGGGDDTVYEDYTTIEQALNAIDEHNGTFEGWVSAVLDDRGAAKFIVINDKNDYSVTNDNGPGSGGNGITIEGVREEILGTISSTPGQTADDQIKAMPDGAFTLPDANDAAMKNTANGGLAGGLNANTSIKDVMFFKFTKPAGTVASGGGGGTPSTFVITIVSKDTGKIVWRDSMTCGASATGGAFFYAQVSSSNSTVFHNSGAGPLATAPLAAGEYTWTVTMDGATVTTDDFTINN